MKLSSVFVSSPDYAHAKYGNEDLGVKVKFTEDEALEIIAIADRAAKRHREEVLKTVETLGAPQIEAITDESAGPSA